MDPSSITVSDSAAITAGFLAVFSVLVVLAILVLNIIAGWKLFKKAGEHGWTILIPFYNMYVLYDICWSTIPFWIIISCSIVSGIATGNGIDFLSNICSIAIAVLNIIRCVKLAKAYGKGGGFAVGLVFLPTIFKCILAFGSAQYIGPNGIPACGAGINASYQPYQPQAAQQPVYHPQPNPAPYGYDPYTGQPLSTPAQAPNTPQAPATQNNAPQANPYDSYKSDF